MALKDLASDLANFKYGISSPDKVDNQIERGVDFFDDKTAGAKGFTPNTDLLTKYNQFMKDVRQNNTLPNQYDGESNILAPNSGLRTNTKTSHSSKKKRKRSCKSYKKVRNRNTIRKKGF